MRASGSAWRDFKFGSGLGPHGGWGGPHWGGGGRVAPLLARGALVQVLDLETLATLPMIVVGEQGRIWVCPGGLPRAPRALGHG